MRTPAPDPRAHGDDAGWHFGLFAAMLAIATLLHELWWDGFELASLHAAVDAAALLVLLRPASVPRFSGLLAIVVLSVARDMPGAGSHTLLVGVVGATVLAHVAWTVLSTRQLPRPGALFARVAPFLRLSLLVLYGAAATAKLNGGYFDPAVSCGAAMAPSVVWFDPGLLGRAGLAWPAIVGSVLVEASLPVLLAVRRTRLAGLALGTGFHLVLALAGNVPFSALVLALYVAFLPPELVARARAIVGRRRAPGWFRPAVAVACVGLWLLGARASRADPAGVQAAIGTGTRLAVVVLVLAVAALALAVRRRGHTRTAVPAGPWLRLGPPVFAVGTALLVANALSPYAGLKTESSFAMFSNLQTEAGSWNHLLIPEAVRVFSPQDRLVTVTASDDPALLRRTRNGTRMVAFELGRYLRLHPGVHATTSPAGAAAAAPPPLAGLVDRVAKFRDVRAPGRSGC